MKAKINCLVCGRTVKRQTAYPTIGQFCGGNCAEIASLSIHLGTFISETDRLESIKLLERLREKVGIS